MNKKKNLILTTLCCVLLAVPPGFALDAKEAAIDAYKKGQYAKAVELMAPLIKQYPKDDNLRAKYAYSLVKVKKYEAARREFEYIVEHSSSETMIDYAKKALATIPSSEDSSTDSHVSN